MKDLNIFKQFAPKVENSSVNTTNAVVYTRVSSAGQEDNTSLESQKNYCEKFAVRKDLTVVEFFGGTHESAKTDDRKEFNRMLSFVKKAKTISYIIVYSYERFSRSGINGAQIADDLLKKYGIITLAVSQELDPTTPAGSFQQKILFLFGQMDNEMRRDKVVTGMTELLRKGYWVWSVPRGYSDLNKGRSVDRKIIVNEEGKLMRKAFEWKAQANMSNVEISRRLKLLGLNIPDKRLNELFKNPFHCGLITSKMIPGEVVEGRHEAMVSKSLFLQVNNLREENRSHSYSFKSKNETLPLKVFMKCDKCKESLTGYLVKKKNLLYYKCSTKGCKTNRSAKLMHDMFINALTKFRVSKENLELLKIKVSEQYDNFFDTHKSEIIHIKSRLTEKQKNLDLLEERFVLGDITKEMFQKFNLKFSKEKADLSHELLKLSNSTSNLEKAINFTLKICQNPSLLWVQGGLKEKQLLQNFIFPEGIYYNREKDESRTFQINPFFSVIAQFQEDLDVKEKRDFRKKSKIPLLVVPPGLEPGTF